MDLMFTFLQGVFARTQIPQKVHFLRNLVFAKKAYIHFGYD